MSERARQFYEAWREAVSPNHPSWEVALPVHRDAWELVAQVRADEPIPMILTCPSCCARHIDEGEFATKSHHTHACQKCGMVWRPALVPTVGVQFLPGFKNSDAPWAKYRQSRAQSGSIPHAVPVAQTHGPHDPERDLHHSQGIEVAAVLAGTPLSRACECGAGVGYGCRNPDGSLLDGEFHVSRVPDCGMVFMEGGVEKLCQLPAGHETSRHGMRR